MSLEIGIWEIAVLALLREAPMHPYQMQRLIKERHKDEVLALKHGSLYHAIARLLKAGLIEAGTTGRDGRRPERTTYRIATAGIETLLTRLRQIVATPKQESSEFMAAMSFLVHLSPEDARKWLLQRAGKLEAAIFARTEGMAAVSGFVDRINLIESEYLLAMLRAELKWVRGLEEAIMGRSLSWDTEAQLEKAEASRKAPAAEKPREGATQSSSPVPKREGPGAPPKTEPR